MTSKSVPNMAELARTVAELQAFTEALAVSTRATKSDTPRKITVAQPAADVALHTFGATFTPGIGPSAAELRRKADAEEMQTRRDALPVTVTTWAERLTFAELEALAAVQRFYDANNRTPVAIPRADLAAHLRVTPDEADALLNGLAKAGAITRNLRLQSAPRYVPVASPPAPKRSQKSATPTIARHDPSALPRLRSALGVRPQ